MLNFNGMPFFTQQIFLIGTYDENSKPRFAPISWVSYTWGEPNCLVISINGTKKTKDNIERNQILSATIVTPDLLPAVEQFNRSTYDTHKAEVIKLDICKGTCLDVPLITGSKFSYECRIIKTVQLGTSHTYFAEIRNINMADEIAALDWLDLNVINPVIYSPNNYFTVGKHLGEIGDFSL